MTARPDWHRPLALSLAAGQPAVLVLIAAVRGSTPREAGAGMLVTARGSDGSIGGGRLEFLALERAVALLGLMAQDGAAIPPQVAEISLGADCGQCCGGWVRVLLLPCPPPLLPLLEAPGLAIALDSGAPAPAEAPSQPVVLTGGAAILSLMRPLIPVWLFGAGHVGQALAWALNPLPFAVTWIDGREAFVPAAVPPAVQFRPSLDAVAECETLPSDAWVLIMTHDHDLDERLCAAALRRGHRPLLGMIGSATKSARFRQRLRAQGLDPAALVCPIGLPGLPGKEPAVIAASVAADLLIRRALPANLTDHHVP